MARIFPLISVIIPCYNQAQYLPDALNSILNQTFNDWECIIINDGSSDNTNDVVCGFLNQNKKFKYIEQANRGLAATRNKGLDNSKGEFIQFLDADDIIDRNKFEKQLALLSKTTNLALSYTDYFSSTESDLTRPYPHGRYLPPTFVHENKLHDLILRWETEMSIPVHCFLFDARFFNHHKIRFDETLPNHEDWDCWMNIFRLNPEVYFVPEKFAIYRIHTDSMVYDRKKMCDGYIKALSNQKNSFNRMSCEYEFITKKMKMTKERYKKYNYSIKNRIINLIRRIFTVATNIEIVTY